MFYQIQASTIDLPSTYLDPRTVYSGNYWDEFGITPFLVPDHAEVLVLGAGRGGGIRPILSSDRDINLTCIDFDASESKNCREYFQNNFPNLEFELIISDAQKYLQTTTRKFHFIWIDLYNSDSHSELHFSEDFISIAKNKLHPRGVLAINAYGVPAQFSPLELPTAQRKIKIQLEAQFSWVNSLPHRRNQTLIASDSLPALYPTRPHPELFAIDKKSFLLQGVRLEHLFKFNSTALKRQKWEMPAGCFQFDSDGDFARTFAEHDELMRAQWNQFLEHLKSYEICLERPRDLLNLIQDHKKSEALLDLALKRSDRLLMQAWFNLCAGESFVHSLNVDWILPWAIQNSEILKLKMGDIYQTALFPQLWSLVLNPTGRNKKYAFQVFACASEGL